MSARQATPRAIRKALDVLLGLPTEALADLTERLVDRLDAGADPDMEPEPENSRAADDAYSAPIGTGDADDAEEDNEDCCPAGDDDPSSSVPLQGVNAYQVRGPGDPDDGEDGGDREPSAVEAWTGASL